MPRLIQTSVDVNSVVLPAGNSGYRFSAIRPDRLGATEYTLATIVLDYTGSTSGFASELEQMLKVMLAACRMNPRANNLLVRTLIFSTSFQGGTEELHGFKPLADIDLSAYSLPYPSGLTPLVDAAYDAAAATNAFGKTLFDQDYAVNSIIFVITDGGDNASSTPSSKVKKLFREAVKREYFESNFTILVALNSQYCKAELNSFKNDAGFDHYIDVADATPSAIAKLGGFISQSISSQSQALGTGGPSQNISAVI
jgi:hypothetical protein